MLSRSLPLASAAVWLAAVAVACGTTVREARLSDDASYVFVRGISPTAEKSIFRPSDEKVTLSVEFANNFAGGQRTFTARWVGPDGNVFREDPVKTKWGSNEDLVATLAIAQNLPSKMPGLWSVTLLHEDEVLVTRKFEILAESE